MSEGDGNDCSTGEATGNVHMALTEPDELEAEGTIGIPSTKTLHSLEAIFDHHSHATPVHLDEAQCRCTLWENILDSQHLRSYLSLT